MDHPPPPPPVSRPRRRGRTKVAATLAAALAAVVSLQVTDAYRGLRSTLGAILFPQDPVEVAVVRPPVSWYAQTNDPAGPVFVIPRPLRDIPPPPVEFQARHAWAAGLGGADAGSTLVEILVTGRDGDAVVLNDLRVVVLDRRPALRGTLVRHSPGGDAMFVRTLRVDLDVEPPIVTPGQDHRYEVIIEGTRPEEPVRFPFRVSESVPEVFSVVGTTTRQLVEWVIEIDVLESGGVRTVVVDDNGHPFVTTPWEADLPSVYSNDGETFQPVEEPASGAGGG